ncbi:MAG: helix-turn-helix domain-containing protein [Lachnospiraceae bacterium]
MSQKIKISPQFGKNLRTLRKQHGYTQEELVIKLQLLGQDISRSIYAQMECGSYNIRITELVALKEIYDISYDEFFKDIQL